MRLRAYRPDDCRDVYQVFYAAVHAVRTEDYSQAQLDAWAPAQMDGQAWHARLLRNDRAVVAVSGDALVGIATADDTGYFDMLYVHRDDQRRGVATRLADDMEAYLFGKGVRTVTVDASIPAKRFFEGRGYRVRAAQTVACRGQILTNFRMEKALSAPSSAPRRHGGSMEQLTFELVQGEGIEQCRALCDELMAYQKTKAHIAPEIFDLMNFDTRMKKSYLAAPQSHVVVAKADSVPVGYVFSTAERITPEDRDAFPAWAPRAPHCIGFYPDWVPLPQKLGCLSNLYVREAYRGQGLGCKLFDMGMAWLDSLPDVALTFVFISNGNGAALDFYLRHGFAYSHDVFGGFILAAYKQHAR